MSQAQWDRSTIGGAGADAGRRRMLGAAAAGLAAGLTAGFIAGIASGVVSAHAQTLSGPADIRPGPVMHDPDRR
ncbi:hypothetical protein [Variovorax sp. JS1663]|uniref:hypothetical protein n=1 Tax=Variovorax sp. JS1663 TaxID=1851577 RepID=UPI000B344A9E|nr:hypothetical protein [Variovorax sp. JS1663]OUL99184.1 hypothetical protein A8M77_27670 [Variovorax sp. JS1663]